MIYYVWSGTLEGVSVEADCPLDAVEQAVSALEECVLGPSIRVSTEKTEKHHDDVYYDPPYENYFPNLFDGQFDVQIVPVERL